MGSKYKFKYGPLGNTVNLASRIQGLTKHWGTRLLISDATRCLMKEVPPSRRLGSARVVGVEGSVELYEVPETASPEWMQLRDAYQDALASFERREFAPALGLLSEALRTAASDRPSLLLLSRAASALTRGPEADHPVCAFTEK